jgi:outer membrane receptor for ferric coprogen and ferric-rhodotorulic acid
MTSYAAVLAGISVISIMVVPARAAEANSGEQSSTGSDIVVTAAKSREAGLNESASATGLDLSLRETPQSVTVVDRQRIDDFALTNVNDLLEQTVGITVQRNETDRTDYAARGFAITNLKWTASACLWSRPWTAISTRSCMSASMSCAARMRS